MLSDGDRIKVMVLSQDKERGRLQLCTKKLEPQPGGWQRERRRDRAVSWGQAKGSCWQAGQLGEAGLWPARELQLGG